MQGKVFHRLAHTHVPGLVTSFFGEDDCVYRCACVHVSVCACGSICITCNAAQENKKDENDHLHGL